MVFSNIRETRSAAFPILNILLTLYTFPPFFSCGRFVFLIKESLNSNLKTVKSVEAKCEFGLYKYDCLDLTMVYLYSVHLAVTQSIPTSITDPRLVFLRNIMVWFLFSR